ncbi:four helix bundle protein [Planctellipticum variicoloris]|uniref:four helix bundle protein n=1 Tax=Planctellipticum variicoloris TaxID=3064265 RepID=UPI003013AA23|nr:four helix bundle protein [Planctomycetaceae bacterium SH412]
MAKPVSYRDLDVWQKSMELVELVYEICRQLPSNEKYGLISQMQRAAVSVPSNIAEGFGLGAGGYRRHVLIARGSLMELEVQLELAVRLKLIDRKPVADTWPIAQNVGQMLTKLALSLKES